jgi:hypothetical protein
MLVLPTRPKERLLVALVVTLETCAHWRRHREQTRTVGSQA